MALRATNDKCVALRATRAREAGKHYGYIVLNTYIIFIFFSMLYGKSGRQFEINRGGLFDMLQNGLP